MSIQSKHFLNTSDSLVVDSLHGLCDVNNQLALDADNKVVYLASPDRSKVALLCGGGSGHEPAHAGFVGDGILTAAVCGNIFASPNASQVRRGLDLVDNDKGTVIIVKNYTGDVLNFGLAKEQYAVSHPDRSDRLKFVNVADDVAIGRKQGSIVGRRGLAGTVLVYKIAGALARRGAGLDEVHSIAQWVSSRIGTIGVGLQHCHVPGSGSADTYLSDNEIEIGMGIHNESGHRRVSPVPPLKYLIPQLLDLITSTTDKDRSFLPFLGNREDNVILLVNNLGGLSELELGGIVAETRRTLEKRGINIQRVLSGRFMTSLNMPGFSITLLLLPSSSESSTPTTSSLLSLLDEPCNAPGWKWSSKSTPSTNVLAPSTKRLAVHQMQNMESLKATDTKQFIRAIGRACIALVQAEPEITHMDTVAGDGDCGTTLKAGAQGVLAKIVDGTINGTDVIGAVITIAQVAEEKMGGTSGALYSIFFSALAQGLQKSNFNTLSQDIWSDALSIALTKLYTYTLARPPSRTLVDPLAAFVEVFPMDAKKALKAAQEAAEATKGVDAKAGRSAYVEGNRLRKERVADPGAWGVKVILENILSDSGETRM